MTLDIDSKKKEAIVLYSKKYLMPKERNLIVTEGQISRREFLKFLGSGAVARIRRIWFQ